jgi:hypothetical protein
MMQLEDYVTIKKTRKQGVITRVSECRGQGYYSVELDSGGGTYDYFEDELEIAIEPLIKLNNLSMQCVTTKEYEAIRQELMTRALVDDVTIGDRVLAQLLQDNNYRYNECRAIKGELD